MFLQTIIIVGVMLGLLTLVSTLGGSMNIRERFEEGSAADSGETGQLSGEILRATDRKMREVAEEMGGHGAPGGENGGGGGGENGGGGGGENGGGGGGENGGGGGHGGGENGGGGHGGGGGGEGGGHVGGPDKGSAGSPGGHAGAQGDGLGAVEPYEDMVASWDGGDRRSGGRR